MDGLLWTSPLWSQLSSSPFLLPQSCWMLNFQILTGMAVLVMFHCLPVSDITKQTVTGVHVMLLQLAMREQLHMTSEQTGVTVVLSERDIMVVSRVWRCFTPCLLSPVRRSTSSSSYASLRSSCPSWGLTKWDTPTTSSGGCAHVLKLFGSCHHNLSNTF